MGRDLFHLRDLVLHRASAGLPPGQREISTHPRFGSGMVSGDPPAPVVPTLEISGDGIESAALDAAALAELPRHEVVADFHCVSGWTTRNLHWEGVRLRDLLEATAAPALDGSTHLRACGRDGFRAALLLEDALGDDVMIADGLDGKPLPIEHGGPWRLVSPKQYGYKSVKHLSRIELHTGEPSDRDARFATGLVLSALGAHPRGRVWEEERHRHLPAQILRLPYRALAYPAFYAAGYVGALRTRRP